MQIQCNRCKYIWEYGGTNWNFVTCPKCFHKIKIRGNPKDQFLAGIGKYGAGYDRKYKCPRFIVKLGTKFCDAIRDRDREVQFLAFIKRIQDDKNLIIGIDDTEAPALISDNYSKPATELRLDQFCYVHAIPRVKHWYDGKRVKKLRYERYFEILDIEPIDFNTWAEEHLADDSPLTDLENLLGNPSSANMGGEFRHMVSEFLVGPPEYMTDSFVNMLMGSPQFSFDRFNRSGGVSTTLYPGLGVSNKDAKGISHILSKLILPYENFTRIFGMRNVVSLPGKPMSKNHADFLSSWRPLKSNYPEENVTSFVTDMRIGEHIKSPDFEHLSEIKHLFRDSLKVEGPLYMSKGLLGNIKELNKKRIFDLAEDISNYAFFKRMTVRPSVDIALFEATQRKSEREVSNPDISYKELVGEGNALDTNQWAISTIQVSRAMCRLSGKKSVSSIEVKKAFVSVRDSKFKTLDELTEGSYKGMGGIDLKALAYRIYLLLEKNGTMKTDEIIASINAKPGDISDALKQLSYEGYVTQPLLGLWRAIPK